MTTPTNPVSNAIPATQNLVTPDEGFTRDRTLMFEQAAKIERVVFGNDAGCDPTFLIFSRFCDVVAPERYKDEVMLGSHIAAYRCGADGHVFRWDTRFEVKAHDYHAAVNKFRFMLANDLIFPEVFKDTKES